MCHVPELSHDTFALNSIMIVKYVIIIMSILSANTLLAQNMSYKFQNEYYLGEYTKNVAFQNYTWKLDKDMAALLIYSKDSCNLVLFDVKNKKFVLKRSIGRIDEIVDFQLIDSSLYVLIDKFLWRYDISKNEMTKLNSEEIRASRIEKLSNSELILYEMHPFHPFDGKSEIYINKYNIPNKSWTTRMIGYESIVLAQMIHQWLCPKKDGFLLVHPLTGIVYEFNSNLNLIDSFSLEIGLSEEAKNKGNQFTHSLYSQKISDDVTLLHLRDSLGMSFFRSNKVVHTFHTKEAIYKRMDTVRKHFVYVEKILPVDDSLLLITINRPGYGEKYRDVILTNNSGMKIKSWSKWKCSKQSNGILTEIEQYFVIDLLNSFWCQPFFRNNKVFKISNLSAQNFKSGTKNELNTFYFKQQAKKRYKKWYLQEYSLL